MLCFQAIWVPLLKFHLTGTPFAADIPLELFPRKELWVTFEAATSDTASSAAVCNVSSPASGTADSSATKAVSCGFVSAVPSFDVFSFVVR